MLNLKNAKPLRKNQLKKITGGNSENLGDHDLSLCGCDCTGTQTGPPYCALYFGCLQVYNCVAES